MSAKRKPWDARISAWLVAPLVHTPIHPNVLTTLRLLVGMAGAVLFATGRHPNEAAFLVVASNFLDHTDGELARLSGKTSAFGHRYDLASDALVTVGMFVGIGIGLSHALGAHTILLGALAGTAVAAIFQMRGVIEASHGKTATQQPSLAGFEAEDVLYLMPVVTLTGQLQPFLIAAAIGAPLAALLVLRDYRRIRGEA